MAPMARRLVSVGLAAVAATRGVGGAGLFDQWPLCIDKGVNLDGRELQEVSCPISCLPPACAAGSASNGGVQLTDGRCHYACSKDFGGQRYCGTGPEYETGGVTCTGCAVAKVVTAVCPDSCSSPTCLAGASFNGGTALAANAVCLNRCSKEYGGSRYCGVGEAYEIGDSISCAPCDVADTARQEPRPPRGSHASVEGSGAPAEQPGKRRPLAGRYTFAAPQDLDPQSGRGRGAPYVADPSLAELYLTTLRDALTGTALKTPTVLSNTEMSVHSYSYEGFNDQVRDWGLVWCDFCYTMVGNARLSHVRLLLERAIEDGVEGDFLEAGVWRGGNSIFARAVQRVRGEGRARRTYVCDSFMGLPEASTGEDLEPWSAMSYLEVSLDEVRDHFERFQMLDRSVVFVRGFFVDSLPLLREELRREGRRLAVLYGDGDMFESYYDILYNLYDLVSVGGFFVCDDCPLVPESQLAIDRFRADHGITEALLDVPASGAGRWWRKERDVRVDYAAYERWNATRHFVGKT